MAEPSIYNQRCECAHLILTFDHFSICTCQLLMRLFLVLSIDSADNIEKRLVVHGQNTVGMLDQHVQGEHTNEIWVKFKIIITYCRERSQHHHLLRGRHRWRSGRHSGRDLLGPWWYRSRGHCQCLHRVNEWRKSLVRNRISQQPAVLSLRSPLCKGVHTPDVHGPSCFQTLTSHLCTI